MKLNIVLMKSLLLIIGSAGIAFSGLNWHNSIAAWIAPIFLLLFTRKAKWYQMLFFFLFMAVAGAISQTGNNLMNLPSVDIFNGISFGILYTIAFSIDKILYRKNSKFYYSLVFPAIFVAMEYLLNPIFGTWGSITHTQYEFKPLIQLSTISGVYSVSFIVFWFSAVVYWLIEKKGQQKEIARGSIILGSAMLLVLLYGTIRISALKTVDKTVKVAALLADTDVHAFAAKEKDLLKELSEDYSLEIPSHIFSDSLAIEKMIKKTEAAAMQAAKIIAWNEIALILNQEQKKDLIARTQNICKKEKAYVLLALLEESPEQNIKPFNNICVFISPDGEVVWDYKKSFVHPIAEDPIINSGNYEIPSIQTEYGKIGSVICSDLDITEYIKQAGEKSIDILLVPGYDWKEITPLHPQMACMQAIQFGFSMIRPNGCGISTICNFKGEIVAELNTFNSNEKILYAEVPLGSTKTIYTVVGNSFVYLLFAFIVFVIIKRIMPVKRKNKTKKP